MPGGKLRGAKVALRWTAVEAMPRQFGPRRRAPCSRTSARSRSCRSDAFAARLGEARRDDDERADAGLERLLCRVEHQLARQADDREVDRLRDLRHRAVAVDAGDGVAVAVHRVHGAGEVAGEDVAEELAADRAAALRGADDGDGARPEERLERGAHRDVVAFGDVLAVRVVGAIARRISSSPPSPARGDREAGVAEDAEHPSLSCSTSATNSSIPACAARAASCSSRRVPIPRRWKSSSTVNATSATRGSRSLTQFATATMRPSSEPSSAPRSCQSGSSTGSTSFGPSAGKPWKRR